MADSDQQCWSHFSIGAYGKETIFSLSYFKYCSNLYTVSEKKKFLVPKYLSWCFAKKYRSHRGGREPPFLPLTPMLNWDQHFRFFDTSRNGRIDGNFETRILRIDRTYNEHFINEYTIKPVCILNSIRA